jgi:hypothetical protein
VQAGKVLLGLLAQEPDRLRAVLRSIQP